MFDIKNMIPVLPSAFLPENINAIDWGSCGIACFATGSTINFFEVECGKINRLYSYDFRPSIITALKFHSFHRWMAFGDNLGNLLFWDVEKRGSMCSILPYANNSKCLDLCWQGNSVIALFSNNHLVQLSYNANNNTDVLRRIEINWDIQLKASYKNIQFDVHHTGYLLLSSSSPQFSVYQYNQGDPKPKSFYECVELSCPDNIQDIQWSKHFPGFIWVVLENEIVFFHIESKTLIPLIRQRASASSFSKIFQLHDTHTRFIVLHRNGLLSVFDSKPNTLKFSVTNEIQPKHSNSTAVKCVKNVMSDKELFIVYSELGPVLYDVERSRIVHACFNFPLTITSIDCNDEYYAFGTSTGIVQICKFGSFDLKEMKRFQVFEGAVDFVGISNKINKIYFKGSSAVGEIRLDTFEVVIYNSRVSSAKRCISTHSGAFIVQRESHILGIFINGKETPVLLPSDIVDIAVKESISGPLSGELGVLLKSKAILFIKYNDNDGAIFLPNKFSISAPVLPISLCLSTKQMVIAFDNGNLLIHDFSTKKSKNINVAASNISVMRFCQSKVFGICNNNTLFVNDSKGFRTCPSPVTSFVPVTPDIVFVIGKDRISRFLRVSDWRSLSSESKILQPDTLQQRRARHIQNHPLAHIHGSITNEELASFDTNKTENLIHCENESLIENAKKSHIEGQDPDKNVENLNSHIEKFDCFGKETPWFYPDMRNIWLILHDPHKVPLSLQYHSGAGETGNFERIMSMLYSAVQYVTPEFLNSKVSSALFANNFDEAVNILSQDTSQERDFLKSAALAGCIIACSEEDKIPDKMVIHLKATAISLLLQGNYNDGAMLFRMARLDHPAVDYLLEHEQLDLALKFIRGCVKNEKEKRELLIKIGVKYYQKGKIGQAILIFAACQQWHVVLGLIRTLTRKADLFFLKKYCVFKGVLKPMPPELEKVFPEIQPLIPLIAQIDIDFAEYATDVGVSSQVLRNLLS
ncbi:hypothetical protein TRFO_27551 [Tritrichomonas foetus]|uniref:Uncharacterized protein n=1 Tax=Tritrichomonas foetus TaxID=1144522 RepID=A0A1J4K578_9EUKA|nr:hypothetical protein TRFO_27551 [Tritrichomonas foetus]|eukprot:OHT04876.1 hypothetical protein TRFO_27551 [Tritrichomonas foetus]